ncbi:iron-containing alcohol dehydrogenase family protein [Candidatus Leptofilum sp.]|uniref:iron-containing alcohol dehydrogenase family protein n=1 Tax=Candidatus Leptofilum sp. TaxID=3241576 RepID=UPI003B5B24A8
MKTFKFQARTKLLAGPDSVQQLGTEVNALGVNHVLVVTDQGIVNAGLLDAVLRPLHKANITTTIFDQVEPNPTDETALVGGSRAQEQGAQAIVALGGGSPIDAAKAIAVMATNDGPFVDYCGAGGDPWPNTPLPIIAIPTTAGTGAEVSAAGMINLPKQGRKVDIFGASILPKVAIADANLTVTLPPHLTAWTGVDALSHAVEAYLCLGANPVSDAIAEGAIRLVAQNIRRVFLDGSDIEARHNMLVASAMAVIAASGAAGLGVIHSLAQTLGGFYDLPHGLTIAVCFADGLAYNLPTKPEKLAAIAHLLGVDTSKMTMEEAAKSVIPAIRQLNADLNITDTYASMNVQRDDIPKLAEYALLDGCTPTNPRPLTHEAFVMLFEGGFH